MSKAKHFFFLIKFLKFVLGMFWKVKLTYRIQQLRIFTLDTGSQYGKVSEIIVNPKSYNFTEIWLNIEAITFRQILSFVHKHWNFSISQTFFWPISKNTLKNFNALSASKQMLSLCKRSGIFSLKLSNSKYKV